MTKSEMMKEFNLDAAPADVKSEVTELLADLPDELSDQDLQTVASYLVSAQTRETELAMDYKDVASAMDSYVAEIDRNLDEEDQQIATILHDNLEAAQNLAA